MVNEISLGMAGGTAGITGSGDLSSNSNDDGVSSCDSSINSDTNYQPPKESDRYGKDFEELGILGRGGFGVVSRARHNLDRRDYAVKKILLRVTSTLEFDGILREVTVMSRLQHPHVARYFNSWIQPLSVDERPDEGQLSVQSSYGGKVSEDNENSEEYSDDSCVTFDRDSNSTELRLSPYMREQIVSIPSRRNGLYIQMQLGRENLQQWLASRNDTNIQPKELFMPKNIAQHIQIFKDITSGLDYLHLNGIIHRDVKPANIVFHQDSSSVFLTDFGLSKFIEGPDISSGNGYLKNTQSIGSPIYTAPEIRSGSYTIKADIFSLGIVLMELICPFSSMTERAKILEKLNKSNCIDVTHGKNWNYVAKQILRMTRYDPDQRPDANTIHRFVIGTLLSLRNQMCCLSRTETSTTLIGLRPSESHRRGKSSHAAIPKSRRKSCPGIRGRNRKTPCFVLRTEFQAFKKDVRKDLSKIKEDIKRMKSEVLQKTAENAELETNYINLMISEGI